MKATKTAKTIGNALLSLVLFGAFNYVIFNPEVFGQFGETANAEDAIEQNAAIEEDVEFANESNEMIPAEVIEGVMANSGMSAETETAAVEEEEAVAYTAPQAAYYNTISVNGNVMGVADSYDTVTAPSEGAGLWKGSLSTTDGSWAYIIGHNPGSFECVSNLYNGAPVTVWDATGASRTYTVFSVFDIPSTTYWEELAPEVTGYGESLILQTCLPGSMYRIVLAA